MVLHKKTIFLIIILISTSVIIPIVQALQTQSLTDVTWEDLPENITELSNYSLEIDFDFTASSLQNYTIQTNKVTILNITNPSGCIILQSNISCESNLEPQILVTTGAIDTNTTIYWTVYTNDAIDGAEIWSLNFSLINTVEAPQITIQTPNNYSIQPTSSNLNINFSYLELNYSIQNATLNYLSSSSHTTSLNEENTNLLIFDCNESTDTCNYTINPSELMNFSANEFYFNSYIQIYDTAGNQRNDSQVNFYIDNEDPSISNNNPSNNSKTNNETIEFIATISDNSLSTPTNYNSEFNCTFYLNNTALGYNSSNTSTIIYNYNISSHSETTYNWSFSCSDQSNNFNSSTLFYFTIDRTNPNITNQSTSSIASSSFTISANSSEETIITIFYSTNQTLINNSYQNASNQSASSYSTTPSHTLTGLTSSTTYYYKIQACDEDSNCAVSDIQNQTTNAITASSSSSSSSSGGGGGGGGRSSSSTTSSDTDLDSEESSNADAQLSIDSESNDESQD
ncbi:hypothetical protein CL619_00330 [archaeon]|nr:hypothetical protein [archaeon]|tara:strand:+ start:884 stop:2422 length:1539 start_codon:yes stop_codon:yes gene_type:complete